MKKIYCISGLGADQRVFHNLKIDNAHFEYLSWITPAKNESIEDYAFRMSLQVKENDPVLMGVSFGGMMSIEIAKIKTVQKLILISSVKSIGELPAWMKVTGKLKLNLLMPPRSPQWMSPIADNYLGVTSGEEKTLAKSFREIVSPDYLHWAVDKVLNWQNTDHPAPIFHIHGTHDKTFPIRNIRPTHAIQNGGHFMVMNKADEISAIVKGLL
jgi:pimeloyl-ACP methyl ester carboxylesterase